MKLRPYQLEAVEQVLLEWNEHAKTLIIMPTGTGKTQTFCEVIRRRLPHRALILAHREELIFQARDRVVSCGIDAEIEMADMKASSRHSFTRASVVVSTVQTQGHRMTRFDPFEFDTLIIDEAHHSVSKSYKRLLEYYCQNPNLRVLGVTATPDRADEHALGNVFESVAYDYRVLDAMNDGWLVPIFQKCVHIEDLDYSGMRTTAGDLNGADLALCMEREQNLHGVANACLELCAGESTLVFAASVAQAERLAEIMNRYNPGCADWLCGMTPKEDRRQKLEDFAAGKVQYMVNCAVLTEGFDSVGIRNVVMARPTKSRSLYAQMVGRATRPLKGIVDGPESALLRKEAIARSDKKQCCVIDFVGNAGRHKLVTTADILGGKHDDEIIERAKKKAEKSDNPVNMVELMEEEEAKRAEEQEARRLAEVARRAKLQAKAQYSVSQINPFDVLDITPHRENAWDRGKHLSDKQRDLLLKQGINPDGMPYAQAKQLIARLFHQWNNNLASVKQLTLLKRYNVPCSSETSRDEASRLINELAKKYNWKSK